MLPGWQIPSPTSRTILHYGLVFGVDRFAATGIIHLPGAFPPDEAAAMADCVWRYVEARSPVRRQEAESWPDYGHLPPGVSLKGLKDKDVFQPAVRNSALCATLDTVLGERQWSTPRRGPRILVTFPSAGPWVMPTGWHIDAGFETPAYPVPWLQLWAVVEPLQPGGGGTLLLAGSHNLVDRYRQGLRSDELGGNGVSWGRFMKQHPYLDQLRRGGSSEMAGREWLGQVEDIDGIPVQPVEVSGQPGDIYLSHGLVFHCASSNTAASPRLMLTGGFPARGVVSTGMPSS